MIMNLASVRVKGKSAGNIKQRLVGAVGLYDFVHDTIHGLQRNTQVFPISRR